MLITGLKGLRIAMTFTGIYQATERLRRKWTELDGEEALRWACQKSHLLCHSKLALGIICRSLIWFGRLMITDFQLHQFWKCRFVTKYLNNPWLATPNDDMMTLWMSGRIWKALGRRSGRNGGWRDVALCVLLACSGVDMQEIQQCPLVQMCNYSWICHCHGATTSVHWCRLCASSFLAIFQMRRHAKCRRCPHFLWGA